MGYKIRTSSEAETRRFAGRLAQWLRPGDLLALSGDLGAGKTTFTQGLAQGLGVTERVNSPTFTIIKEYRGRIPLYHMDVYRIGDPEEEFGFQEYFFGDGVTVVEWPERIEDILPDELLWIRLRSMADGAREIELLPRGQHYETICKEICNEYLGDRHL